MKSREKETVTVSMNWMKEHNSIIYKINQKLQEIEALRGFSFIPRNNL